ncbi:hypothetical protein [Polyangium aurulentum]|uniref:hypothetical protein n=1 Tax=Polyangium aurulentum TaxID=2567896 RepID=UPI0010AE87DC|nr:hypothetical protein [Polyangium aurulentum]UQA60378.1 hypothetical protein E8A73_007860 [Polyangium aurulentum]
MEGGRFCDHCGNVAHRTSASSDRRGPLSPVSLSALTALALICAGNVARADEPRSATEPRVMQEPGEVVNVIDAFDEGDPFDISISLGFQYSSKSAKIRRETNIEAPGLTSGGFTSSLMNVASYSEQTSRLIPRVDIGIYKDLALYFRVPIILNNSRELTGLDGTEDAAVQRVVLQGGPGEQLFSLPFKSPDRSGLEYLAVGIDSTVFNQARSRGGKHNTDARAHDPATILFGVEGRFAIGESMHACNPGAPQGQLQCAVPADMNRNGQSDSPFDATDTGERKPGVTRGTIGLEVHTLVSRRIKYIEPYGGFSALFEFQQQSSDYGITDLEGSLVNRPPISGTMTLGMMIIPWENREKFGRLTFDLRAQGKYTSEGRDYSELFDAIGSSSAESLRTPQWARYAANPNFDPTPDPGVPRQPVSVIDPNSQRTYVTGLTDVQQYASIRGQASVTWQASEYVKFTVGFGFTHDQKHGITGDQPCNPTFKDSIERAGPCKSGNELSGETITATGIPNPNYRPTINAVGRRFYATDSDTFDIFASGVVMF